MKGLSGVHQNIYITPDLSLKERQDNKLLREELLRRERNGESELIMRRGQIVSKTPPVNSSMDATQAEADQQHV